MRNAILILALAAGCGTKVGYVDPERAIQQTDEWKSVQAATKAYAESRQPELDWMKDAIQKARASKAPAEEIVSKETKYG
jgi:Skp family chaperone for outer membrane proteins